MFDTLGFIEKKTNLTKRYKRQDIPKNIYRHRSQRIRHIKAEVKEEECTPVGYFKIFKEKKPYFYFYVPFSVRYHFSTNIKFFLISCKLP